MVAGGLPPADALSAWIILRSHIHSPCWQELPTATEIPLALRPPAALARRTRARNGPEAFAHSDGAFQAQVGRRTTGRQMAQPKMPIRISTNSVLDNISLFILRRYIIRKKLGKDE